MKNRWPRFEIMLIGMLACVAAYGGAPVLQMERAPDLKGPWQPVHGKDLPLTPEGAFLDPTTSARGFYRLRITTSDDTGDGAALPLSGIPSNVVAIAQEQLLSSPEEGWDNAELGPVVYPVYHPNRVADSEPAYLEFKVVPRKLPVLPSLPGLIFKSPPLVPRPDLGYILVSLTAEDLPVPEFATEGPTRIEQLQKLANSSLIRPVRFSPAVLVAENSKGELVANLGAMPLKLPETLYDQDILEGATEVVDGKVLSQSLKPKLTSTRYQSYEEFKTLQSKLYERVRFHQVQAAKVAWNMRNAQLPELISVPLKETSEILTNYAIRSFDLENPDIAKIELTPRTKGLKVTGLVAGGSLLNLVFADGTVGTFLLKVGDPLKPIGAAGWSSWTTYYAGGWSDQKSYNQEWDLAGCCSDGYSGCGSTAWAMFYGYWDAKGISNLIGGAGSTPASNNSDVRECIQHIFGYVNSWCVGDQAATNPWDMDEGHQWATHRGEGITISSAWCMPYLSSSPRNKAIHAIRDHSRPALVGTGYLEHYPFAYGYKYREYTIWGVTWATDRYWKVNNGHGNSSGVWVDASGCWFGADGYCY